MGSGATELTSCAAPLCVANPNTSTELLQPYQAMARDAQTLPEQSSKDWMHLSYNSLGAPSIGTLCSIHESPGKLSPTDKLFLEAESQRIVRHIQVDIN
jgi:hypothetical protein